MACPFAYRLSLVASRVAMGGLALGVASGCERVSYWSGQTESDADAVESSADGSTSSQSTGAGTSVDEAAVLASTASCATELYGQLATATTELARAAAAAAASGEEADRAAARDAWRATMDVWEQAEAIRVGPIGPAALPGGGGVRDEIYAWPTTSRCLVEQTIVSRAYANVDFGDFSLVNVRGLGAAEYLLFYEETDNACGPTTSINATGAWALLDDAELAQRKLDYGAAVSAALDLRARQVDSAWRSDGASFGAAFAASGTEGAPFATTQAAVQALFNGLVVAARQLQLDKLAAPLDDPACGDGADATCETVEGPYAAASTRLARHHVAGIARVFDGCASGAGIGLDDLLVAASREDVAVRAKGSLEALAASLDAIEGDDLDASLDEDRAAAEAALAAASALTSILETEVAPALALEGPPPR